MPVSRLKNDKQPVRNKCQPTSANMLAARARPNPNISRFSPPHPARMHEFISAGGPYAVVTVGRVVGIFPNSGVAMAQTVGVPDGALLNLKTWYGALGYYTSEYFAGQCAVIRVQEPPSTTATTTPLAPFPMEPGMEYNPLVIGSAPVTPRRPPPPVAAPGPFQRLVFLAPAGGPQDSDEIVAGNLLPSPLPPSSPPVYTPLSQVYNISDFEDDDATLDDPEEGRLEEAAEGTPPAGAGDEDEKEKQAEIRAGSGGPAPRAVVFDASTDGWYPTGEHGGVVLVNAGPALGVAVAGVRLNTTRAASAPPVASTSQAHRPIYDPLYADSPAYEHPEDLDHIAPPTRRRTRCQFAPLFADSP